ncbi:hypothetical protein ACWATR_27440 [Nostoc sp. UIC 10890]
MANMTLRLTEELEQQIKAVIQTTGSSKHQFIIDAIKDSLSGKVYQSLDAAQQIKEQLDSNRPITEAALDIQNALDMLQGQIHKLSEENRAIREELTKKKEEPEHQFKVGHEVTKQSTIRFSILNASYAIEQQWSANNSKRTDTYRYHPDLGIITREGKTKTGRKSFWIEEVGIEEMDISPDGNFRSPLGNWGYDKEVWAAEEEEVAANRGRGKDPYRYQASEDEELVEDLVFDITPEYLHETYEIPHKELATHIGLDINIEGVWTRFIKDSNTNIWMKKGYYRAIDYASKVKVTN